MAARHGGEGFEKDGVNPVSVRGHSVQGHMRLGGDVFPLIVVADVQGVLFRGGCGSVASSGAVLSARYMGGWASARYSRKWRGCLGRLYLQDRSRRLARAGRGRIPASCRSPPSSALQNGAMTAI